MATSSLVIPSFLIAKKKRKRKLDSLVADYSGEWIKCQMAILLTMNTYANLASLSPQNILCACQLNFFEVYFAGLQSAREKALFLKRKRKNREIKCAYAEVLLFLSWGFLFLNWFLSH